jgi:hypothetical protein
LDPAVKAGFRVRCWKVGLTEQHTRIGLPVVQFRTTVEPAGTANRTSRDQRGKRTGFWHTVQFSRCERRPEGRDSRRWGRATHHGRHASRGRQPTVAPAQRFCGSRQGYQRRRRSNGSSSRDGRIPVWREQAWPLYVRNTDGDRPPSRATPISPDRISVTSTLMTRSDPAQGFGRL